MSDVFAAPEGHRPRRSLGQNFLVDRGIQARIVEAVQEDLASVGGTGLLEIGPGKGALTEGLATLGLPLLLVELDRDLAEAHRMRWAEDPGVRVLQADILQVSPAREVQDPGGLVVVGNIPYNITTPILFHLLARPRPAAIFLMVQKEVGDRLVADAGTGGYGALTVGVQTVADVHRVLSVPAGAFRPRPRVDSVVVRIRPHTPPRLSEAEEEALRDLTRSFFQWRRKQVGTTLRKHPDLAWARPGAPAALAALEIEPRVRPEALSPGTLLALVRHLGPRNGPEAAATPRPAPASALDPTVD